MLSPLSRRSGVWFEHTQTKIEFVIPNETLSLTEQSPITSPLYASVPNEVLSLNSEVPVLKLTTFLPSITLTLSEQAPNGVTAFSIPNESLTFTHNNPSYQPLTVLLPSEDLSLNEIANTYRFDSRLPVITLTLTPIPIVWRHKKVFQCSYQQRKEKLFTTLYSLHTELSSIHESSYSLLTYDPLHSLFETHFRDSVQAIHQQNYQDYAPHQLIFSLQYNDTDNLYALHSFSYEDASVLYSLYEDEYADTFSLSTLTSIDYSDTENLNAIFSIEYQDRSTLSVISSFDYEDAPSLSVIYSFEYEDAPSLSVIFTSSYQDATTIQQLQSITYQDFALLSSLFSTGYLDAPAIRAHLELIYGECTTKSVFFSCDYQSQPVFQQHHSFGYGDCALISQVHSLGYADRPLITQTHSSIYADRPIASSVYESIYTDYSTFRSLFSVNYSDRLLAKATHTCSYEGVDLAPVFQVHYTLLESCEALFTTGYRSEAENLRSIYLTSYALNDEDVTILTGSCWIELDGQTIAVSEVSINADEGSSFYQCSATILHEVDYRKFVVDSEFTVHLFGDTYSFLVDSKNLSRTIDDDGHLSAQMTIEGLSPIVRSAAPRAITITKTWETPILLSAFITELIGPVDYQVADDYIPAYRLSAENAIPLDLARATMESIGALIESLPDGSVKVRKLWPVSMAALNTSTPDHTLNDDRLFAMSEAPENNDWRNRFRIIDVDSSVQDTLEFVLDEGSTLSGTMYAYPSPWRDGLTLRHTRGAPIYLGPLSEELVEMTINSEDEVEPELIEFQEGEASTRYPIESILSLTWLAVDLGAVAFTPHTKTLKSSSGDGYSLAQIRYTTRRLKARTSSSEYTSAQYLLEE